MGDSLVLLNPKKNRESRHISQVDTSEEMKNNISVIDGTTKDNLMDDSVIVNHDIQHEEQKLNLDSNVNTSVFVNEGPEQPSVIGVKPSS